ncbi:hypothetical protein FB446DRAFT_710031 [Lentinula raphanica]|nr:hypothetical protein FB446DRAFT_710031 [Lentinula raphanica]
MTVKRDLTANPVMISLTLNAKKTTSDILWSRSELLDAELARQVEYDMDEQVIIVERITQYISKVIFENGGTFCFCHGRLAAAVGNGKLKSEEERGLKREQRKLQQMNISTGCSYASIEPRLRLAFERIFGYDEIDFFKNFLKLGRHEYWAIKDFRDDIELVLNDAMTYNKAGTPFYKAAQRIHDPARPDLEELEREFEPLLKLVELLLSLKAIKDDSSLVLTSDPISSLVNVELSALRPPPPPLPKPPKASKTPKPKPPKPDWSVEYKHSKAKNAHAGRNWKHRRLLLPLPTQLTIHLALALEGRLQSLMWRLDPAVRPEAADASTTAPPSSPQSLPSSQPGAGPSPSLLQPSKKKIRLDRGTSKLPVFSTVEEENQTLNLLSTLVLVERRLPDLGLPGCLRRSQAAAAGDSRVIISTCQLLKQLLRQLRHREVGYSFIQFPQHREPSTSIVNVPTTAYYCTNSGTEWSP